MTESDNPAPGTTETDAPTASEPEPFRVDGEAIAPDSCERTDTRARGAPPHERRRYRIRRNRRGGGFLGHRRDDPTE